MRRGALKALSRGQGGKWLEGSGRVRVQRRLWMEVYVTEDGTKWGPAREMRRGSRGTEAGWG